ncbi:hypothetical protein NQ318_014252 [Aromia moschata]|uniref:Aladin seven-bladed propeller domain-containing protein n=1 Tax=Aromia moschata TaxID=1265417 RepID=A0AAV8Z037_9CUCU|nr:hypothetical protein NQ318_014252 [Aromia moschata]
MRCLTDFEVPNDGEISLCEINGRMHAMNYNYANVNAFTNTVENYPKIHITRNLLHPVSSGDEGRALFLPVNVSFLKQLTQVYYEQGLVGVTHRFHPQSVDRFERYSSPSLINEVSQARNWSCDTIRCITWHPYVPKLAVATCDDNVRIFSGDDNSITPLLRTKQQRNITCIAWRPLSNTELAVGHENGIIVWNVDPNSSVARPSISNAMILQRIEHRPVVSIAWSPKGDKLISVAACDNTILVWDVELDKTSSLKRPGGSGNILVKWSPTGEKLFTCTNGLTFRVWDCRTWENERWSVLDGRVQSACWSNCGTTLLFATNIEPIIYGVIVKNDLIFSSDVETSSTQAIPLFDATKIDIDGVLVGGPVQCMESDPKGKHLAVLFQDTSCVAVFNIVREPGLQLIASSLVTGLPEEKSSTISFVQKFDAGACLTIGWSSGRIQYYPIVYTDLASNSDSNQTSNTSLYSSFSVSSFNK